MKNTEREKTKKKETKEAGKEAKNTRFVFGKDMSVKQMVDAVLQMQKEWRIRHGKKFKDD